MARYKRRPTSSDMQPGLFDDIEPAPIHHIPSLSDPIAQATEFATPLIIEDQPHHAESRESAEMAEVQRDIEPLVVAPAAARLRFISFGSGSSGNCAYLGTDRGGILIDAGVDPAKVVNTLLRAGIDMSQVGGIILTHDHGDHVRYAYTLLRRFRHLRLYCTPKTLNGILRRHSISRRIKDYHQPVFKEFQFHLGPFVITPFDVSHDGTDNCGFSIETDGHCFVVATDMGVITERADYYMRRANHLMIEANYDLAMLLAGSYPEYLKARIIGEKGHMDNAATASYLADIRTPALENVFLCHLSHDNNAPDKAIDAVGSALKGIGLTIGDFSGDMPMRSADIQLMALPRFDATTSIILRRK